MHSTFGLMEAEPDTPAGQESSAIPATTVDLTAPTYAEVRDLLRRHGHGKKLGNKLIHVGDVAFREQEGGSERAAITRSWGAGCDFCSGSDSVRGFGLEIILVTSVPEFCSVPLSLACSALINFSVYWRFCREMNYAPLSAAGDDTL